MSFPLLLGEGELEHFFLTLELSYFFSTKWYKIWLHTLENCRLHCLPTVLSWSYFFLCCPCPSLDYTPREEIPPGSKLRFVSLRVHRAQTTAVPYDIFISLCTHLRIGLCKNLSVSLVVFRLTCHVSSMNLLGIGGILLFSSPLNVP